jgi:hypothetical protein
MITAAANTTSPTPRRIAFAACNKSFPNLDSIIKL